MKNRHAYNAVGQGEKPNLSASTFEANSPGGPGGNTINVSKGRPSAEINSPGGATDLSGVTRKGSKFDFASPGGPEQLS